MNIKTIEAEIEKAITLIGKCNVSSTQAFREGMSNASQEYGLEIIDSSIDGVAISLYDHKNNTRINFMESFVNKNLIDYHNNNEKSINLHEVFEAYVNLPEKNKV